MTESLQFQEFSHDPNLGGSSPTVDGGPNIKRNRAHLAPKIFHENTQDRTLGWYFEQAIGPLGRLLVEEEPEGKGCSVCRN